MIKRFSLFTSDKSKLSEFPFVQCKGVGIFIDGEFYNVDGNPIDYVGQAFSESGVSFVNSINGKFIIIIWDYDNDRLFFFRDRVGECVLYYTAEGYFSNYVSDIHDNNEWNEVLENEKSTNWKEIFQLPPAHYMEYSSTTGECILHEYWTPIPSGNDQTFEGEEEIASRLNEIFLDSVKIRYQGRCAITCGGYDSSAIACAAKPKEIFSFNNDFSESLSDVKYVKEVAKHIKADIHWSSCNKNGFFEVISKLIVDTDVLLPFNAGHIFHQKVAEKIVEVDPGYTHIMTGTGGDDLFGYIRIGIIAHELAIYETDHYSTWSRMLDSYYGNHVRRLVDMYGLTNYPFERYLAYESRAEALRNMHLFILKNIVPLECLMIRKSVAAHGLESRSPFLDYRLVELAFSYNKFLDYQIGVPKNLLRKALDYLLPSVVSERKHKVGHSLPLSDWLDGENKSDFFKRILMGGFHKNE